MPKRHRTGHAEGEDGGNQRGGQQAGVQWADFAADAKQQCQTEHQCGQRYLPQQCLLQQQAAKRKERAADDQAFKEAFVGRVQPGDVAAGGNQGK
ncbi:hypothetical protein D3C76_1535130 [compost metagenome]